MALGRQKERPSELFPNFHANNRLIRTLLCRNPYQWWAALRHDRLGGEVV